MYSETLYSPLIPITGKRTLSNNQIHEKIGDFLCCTIFTILLIGQKILLIEWKLMSQKMGNQNIFHRDFLKIHRKEVGVKWNNLKRLISHSSK